MWRFHLYVWGFQDLHTHFTTSRGNNEYNIWICVILALSFVRIGCWFQISVAQQTIDVCQNVNNHEQLRCALVHLTTSRGRFDTFHTEVRTRGPLGTALMEQIYASARTTLPRNTTFRFSATPSHVPSAHFLYSVAWFKLCCHFETQCSLFLGVHYAERHVSSNLVIFRFHS
jgi:hypothetical protein